MTASTHAELPILTALPLAFQWESTYTSLPERFYQWQQPTPVPAPTLFYWNAVLANTLGLCDDNTALAQETRRDLAFWLGGNVTLTGTRPFAQAYAGHQFAHFTMLGDGRAIVLGEHCAPNGDRVDVQLKGAGPTPYSRRGDGRAALGPMLREVIISEAMAGLGIPTTRSLAVVSTGEPVYRETPLPGAVLTRIAASHLRVGTLQYAAVFGDDSDIQAVVDYTIARHYPHLAEDPNPALALLAAVMDRQIALMVHWMRVGFVHGVMNTDNMTLSGETIDYGPCAFMNAYDPTTVFSSIDRDGRYAFGNQPNIAQWNLARLAEALLPVIDANAEAAIEQAKAVLNTFPDRFQVAYRSMMAHKLGFAGATDENWALSRDWLTLLQQGHIDYTNAFLALEGVLSGEDMGLDAPTIAFMTQPETQAWLARWQAILTDPADAVRLMQLTNPVVIPRNHTVEAMLAEAVETNSADSLEQYLAILQQPYERSLHNQNHRQPPLDGDLNYKTFCGT